MKIKIMYYCACLLRQKFVFAFNRVRSSNIWSVNEQSLGTFVKVANETSLSTDDKDERGILYFTNIWLQAIHLDIFNRHQKIKRYPLQRVPVDKRSNRGIRNTKYKH